MLVQNADYSSTGGTGRRRLQGTESRENIYRREAKLLLLTEIRATAAPLAAWGVTS